MTVQAIEGGKKYLFVLDIDDPPADVEDAKKQYEEMKASIAEAMEYLGVPESHYRCLGLMNCSVDIIPIDGDPLLIHDEGSAFQKMREGHRDM